MTLRMNEAGALRVIAAVDPAEWPRPKGYSNGMRVPAGFDLLFVAGQIGWNAEAEFETDVFGAQFEQALANCVTVVEAAGGAAHHIVRLTIFCADKDAYLADLTAIGAAYRRVMGRHYPAMSLVEVARLLEPRALVEIEATAALPPTEGER